MLIVVVLPCQRLHAQLNHPDTAFFSFNRLDTPPGDTIYAHAASATTIRRFFEKNLRGIWRDTTRITGKLTIDFFIDSSGKPTGSCYEDQGAPPDITWEVMRVTNRLDRLPLVPTTILGRHVASAVRLKVVYSLWLDVPPDPTADITVKMGEVIMDHKITIDTIHAPINKSPHPTQRPN